MTVSSGIAFAEQPQSSELHSDDINDLLQIGAPQVDNMLVDQWGIPESPASFTQISRETMLEIFERAVEGMPQDLNSSVDVDDVTYEGLLSGCSLPSINSGNWWKIGSAIERKVKNCINLAVKSFQHYAVQQLTSKKPPPFNFIPEQQAVKILKKIAEAIIYMNGISMEDMVAWSLETFTIVDPYAKIDFGPVLSLQQSISNNTLKAQATMNLDTFLQVGVCAPTDMKCLVEKAALLVNEIPDKTTRDLFVSLSTHIFLPMIKDMKCIEADDDADECVAHKNKPAVKIGKFIKKQIQAGIDGFIEAAKWLVNAAINKIGSPKETIAAFHVFLKMDSFLLKKAEDAPAPTPAPPCYEALEGDGSSYRGCQGTTKSGRTCQKWTSRYPQKHNLKDDPSMGLGYHNFCRNPSDGSTIWCYTTDPNKRWEYCEPLPQVCDETLKGNGANYRGCQKKTKSGRTCQKWSSQSPHSHTCTAEKYPDKGLDGNLCRNPGGSSTIWCYTTDPNKRWEYCNPGVSSLLDGSPKDGMSLAVTDDAFEDVLKWIWSWMTNKFDDDIVDAFIESESCYKSVDDMVQAFEKKDTGHLFCKRPRTDFCANTKKNLGRVLARKLQTMAKCGMDNAIDKGIEFIMKQIGIASGIAEDSVEKPLEGAFGLIPELGAGIFALIWAPIDISQKGLEPAKQYLIKYFIQEKIKLETKRLKELIMEQIEKSDDWEWLSDAAVVPFPHCTSIENCQCKFFGSCFGIKGFFEFIFMIGVNALAKGVLKPEDIQKKLKRCDERVTNTMYKMLSLKKDCSPDLIFKTEKATCATYSAK